MATPVTSRCGAMVTWGSRVPCPALCRSCADATGATTLVEMFCLELDIPLYGFGEMTLREEGKKRGLEPDEWYCRGKERQPPELALEVVVGNPLLDKLEVYRGLGIREVWVYKAKQGQFETFTVHRGRYVSAEQSTVIPEIDLARVAHYLAMPDQHEALKAFRDELRETR